MVKLKILKQGNKAILSSVSIENFQVGYEVTDIEKMPSALLKVENMSILDFLSIKGGNYYSDYEKALEKYNSF